MKHLVPVVHLNGVVALGSDEVVVPFLGSVIEVTARIDKNVVTAPPEVQVQHVDLREPIRDGSTTECPEVTGIESTQDMIPRM
jgi:hypothetical protein